MPSAKIERKNRESVFRRLKARAGPNDLVYISWFIPLIIFLLFPNSWFPVREKYFSPYDHIRGYASRVIYASPEVLNPSNALGRPGFPVCNSCATTLKEGVLVIDFGKSYSVRNNSTIRVYALGVSYEKAILSAGYKIWLSQDLPGNKLSWYFLGLGAGIHDFSLESFPTETYRYLKIQGMTPGKDESFAKIDAILVRD